MAQVGRISGPLLEANLIRNGIDLAFRNDLNTTQLLYLDVNTGRLAVNSDTAATTIDITGTTRTVNLIANETNNANIANFTIGDNNINITSGNLFLNANEAIIAPNIETEKYFITDNVISTKDNDTSIEFRPNGTGSVDIFNNLNVYSNLHSTGDITFDGTITFGDQLSQDTVDFNSDINSDIKPDQTYGFNLGTASQRWENIALNLLNGQSIDTASAVVQGINLNLRTTNTLYVSVNGSNTNVGDHIQGPLATIQEALARADASSAAPVVIYVFPGEYQEQLPLVVPPNVSIVGHDIRNVIVTPDTTSQSEDVFHLNGETTIQNLTVKNFYYDSINNTGYAFRFAPNAVTSTRSPYIQNVTVITQGTTTSAQDPRGFNSGDAGKGAWIDGAEMNAASFDASMLFHSCTFITPGVDAITMTNGVRVEWLNSFTYFANRGLYAVDGLTGRTSQDGSTIIYGAEIRSIGSASVYGNYGAVADGPGTLMYLIQHNFGYIGSGLDSSNDQTLAIQDNEVVKLNNGKIYYQTTDHLGTFRVGENFFFDFETGNSSIDISSLTTESITGLTISSNGSETVIAGDKVETGNIRFAGNRLDSLIGDVDIASATNVLNLNDNTNVDGSVVIRDNFSFGGTLNLSGDQATDRLAFNVEFDQDFNPHQHEIFNLGSVQKKWLSANLSKAEVGDIQLFDNVITTDVSNADLEIRANNTGRIYVPTNDVEVDNDLTVNNVTNLQGTNVLGTLTHIGNRVQTGNYTLSGEFTVDNVYFEDNFITTLDSNSNLELKGSTESSKIYIPNNNLEVSDDLTVNGTTNLNTFNISGTLTHIGAINQTGSYSVSNDQTVDQNLTVGASAQFEEILVDDNFITTTRSNANLELRASGTGKIFVPENDVIVQNHSLQADIVNAGSIDITRSLGFKTAIASSRVEITENYINSVDNLVLSANGSGLILLPDFEVTNNLTVLDTTTIKDSIIEQGYGPELVNNGTFNSNISGWNIVGGGTVTRNASGQLQITANPGIAQLVSQNITVKPNTDYKFEAEFINFILNDPSGEIYLRVFQSGVGDLAAWFENDLTILTVPNLLSQTITTGNSTTLTIAFRVFGATAIWDNISLQEDLGLIEIITPINVDITGTITQTGNASKDGSLTQVGNTVVDGNLTTPTTLDLVNYFIDDNVIRNKRNGLSLLTTDPSNPLGFYSIVTAMAAGATADDYPNQTEKNLVNFLANGTSVASDYAFSYIDVNQSGSSTTSDAIAWLQYIANGTSGDSQIDSFIKSVIDELIEIEFNNPGTFNKDVLLFGDYFEPDILLKASGTGQVLFPTNDVRVTNNLFASSITANDIDIDQDLDLNEIVTTNGIIEIDDNFISTTVSNANLELRADRNIKIVPSTSFEQNLTVNNITSLKSVTTNGNITQTGNRNQVGNLDISGTLSVTGLFVDSEIQFDDILINDNTISTTTSNSSLELLASGTGNINISNNNVRILQDLSLGSLDTASISINNSLQSEIFDLSNNIRIFDNVITTTESNSSLELRTQPTRTVNLENFIISEDKMRTLSTDITISSDNLIIDATKSLKIPSGNTAQRKTLTGNLRFNSQDSVFEGFSNSKTITFNGVYSDNKRTSVLADPTVNNINFLVNNINVGTVNSLGIVIHGASIDDILVDSNIIRTTVSNSNLEFRPNGTGEFVIDSISIFENKILNNNNGALVLTNENFGIVKFNMENAVAIPYGSTAEQPANPEVGTTRWNTDEQILETWDGNTFISAAGSAETISEEEFQDLMLEYTLIFG